MDQKKAILRLSISAALAAGALSAHAITYNFSGISGSNGQALSATATFAISGGTNLTIVLTNTAAAAANDGANVLDGLYFDIAGNPLLSNGNAALTAGSNLVIKNNNSDHSGNPLNDEWCFDGKSQFGGLAHTSLDTSVGSPINTKYGIGCTGWPGFNTNGETFTKRFHDTDAGAGANDDYGIVPTAGISAGNPTQLYARNSMTFTFTLSSAITEHDLSNVKFSYGSQGQTYGSGVVPEPSALAALAIGGLALLRRRKKA